MFIKQDVQKLKNMPQITNLHASVGDKPILKGLSLRSFVALCEPIFITRSHEGTKKERKLQGISLEGSVG
jgi:hypothetical protein